MKTPPEFVPGSDDIEQVQRAYDDADLITILSNIPMLIC